MDNGLARHCESKTHPRSWALPKGDIAVTEIRCDNPLPEMSCPIQQEDAFLVALHLRDFPNLEYWEDGRLTSVRERRAGETSLADLKREPRALLKKSYHSLIFYLPRAALDAIADVANAPRIRDLSYDTPTFCNIIYTLLTFRRPDLPAREVLSGLWF
jgi:hypothetical protein